MASISQSQDQLERIVKSGELQAIRLFQLNDFYINDEEKELLLIDTAIELTFPIGSITALWSTETDSFSFHASRLEYLQLHNKAYEIDLSSHNNLKKYIGQNVLNVEFATQDFEQVVDYTMKTRTVSLIVGMILQFPNDELLQIAFVDYEMNNENKPDCFSYNVCSELLISSQELPIISQ